MLTDKDEIAAIIDAAMSPYLPDVESVRILIVPAILAASEAIAALLTLAHRMSEFVTLSSHRDIYTVLDPDGRARNVWMKGNGGSKCWIPLDGCQEGCSDSKDRTTCDHVQAVKLYLARQEAKK